MRITEVHHTNRKDVRDFLGLPFRIYKDIPQWVPPLMPGERARFKSDWSFQEHSEAAFFLVRDDNGRSLGRIAVMEHRPYNNYHNTKTALLYLYEAVDDDEVAHLLFDTATDWAKQRGLENLAGPKGFFAGDGIGLLIEGFDHRPAMGIPYNPAYYVHQWEDIGGMQKIVDYISAYADRSMFEYPERIGRLAERIRKRGNFHVPQFKNKREILQHVSGLKEAYNSAFVNLWSYTPIPDKDMEAIVKDLLLIADPELIKFVFKDNELAGFVLVYPDVSAAIQRCKGRIWPFGWIDILLEKRRTKWLCLNGQGVMPKYQGLGANAIVYDEILKVLTKPRYEYGDLVQMQETNTEAISNLEAIIPLNIYKKHRAYKKTI